MTRVPPPARPLQPTRLGALAGLTLGLAASLRGLWLRKKRRELRGQVVVITGGSRGLGLDIARSFARCGTRLVLNARSLPELQRAQATLLHEGLIHPASLLLVPADVSDPAQAKGIIQQATAHFGRVDVLVNNAAVIYVGPALDHSIQNIQHALQTNLGGVLSTTEAVLPQMLARRSGRIVNIASIAGKLPIAHMLPYAVSKFAIVGFSQGMRLELLGKGVSVTTVCPGLMRTGSAPFALFTGNRDRELRWFSLSERTPVWSVSSRRSARRIVDAAATGRAEYIPSPQAWIAARAAALAPGLTLRVEALLNDWLLPDPIGNTDAHPFQVAAD